MAKELRRSPFRVGGNLRAFRPERGPLDEHFLGVAEVRRVIQERGWKTVVGFQTRIVERALGRGKSVFLATQFLKNMETKPLPVIPEILDLYNTLRTDIAGLQLSEETAIGRYPEECVRLVMEMLRLCRKTPIA